MFLGLRSSGQCRATSWGLTRRSAARRTPRLSAGAFVVQRSSFQTSVRPPGFAQARGKANRPQVYVGPASNLASTIVSPSPGARPKRGVQLCGRSWNGVGAAVESGLLRGTSGRVCRSARAGSNGVSLWRSLCVWFWTPSRWAFSGRSGSWWRDAADEPDRQQGDESDQHERDQLKRAVFNFSAPKQGSAYSAKEDPEGRASRVETTVGPGNGWIGWSADDLPRGCVGRKLACGVRVLRHEAPVGLSERPTAGSRQGLPNRRPGS